jgi:8-oxo-dGTP pyrophosphatase MutT (NUDIX family)
MQPVFAAVKAIIVDQDKFLVIKQDFGNKIVWDLPGGKVDYGESPIDTLHREIKEEVGIEVKITKSAGVWWFFRITDNAQVICTTFVCHPKSTSVDLTQNPAEENITNFRWVTKSEFLSGEYKIGHESLSQLISSLEI